VTPEELDAQLDDIQQEISVIVLNLRAEFTRIGMLRNQIRKEGIGNG
jgi:hypothetical protein